MKLEVRTYPHTIEDGSVKYFYDIVDLDDFIMFQGKELHELVAYSSKCWANEEVAKRNGLKHIEELKNDKG